MTLPEPSGQHAQRIAEFIAKCSPGGAAHALNEEQGAQQHFIELCALLGVAPPAGDDDYLFEKGAMLLGQRRGYADVFKRGCFAWENKAPGKPLDAAVAAAYGCADYTPQMPDEEILRRLLALNRERADSQRNHRR